MLYTTRVEKKEKVCEIVNHLISTSTSYIRLRSHIVELDFLGNLELKPKPGVQEVHILVNNLLYTVLLFCEEKRSWWHKLLSNFPLWSIISKLENKKWNHYADSSSTQYKNKYALYLLQSLANTYNIESSESTEQQDMVKVWWTQCLVMELSLSYIGTL